ncbi:hypothetical protein TGRH88_020790 [Toxoplasma gondii]|uniref:Transmembrane protein n=1 Tax=Toxoplasma gondii TaxID=5811 RepID=A0A7J6KGX4_TOXGO|nr:hypothetical protein TGRH88_020790 [Toxoplasma gondii]
MRWLSVSLLPLIHLYLLSLPGHIFPFIARSRRAVCCQEPRPSSEDIDAYFAHARIAANPRLHTLTRSLLQKTGPSGHF